MQSFMSLFMPNSAFSICALRPGVSSPVLSTWKWKVRPHRSEHAKHATAFLNDPALAYGVNVKGKLLIYHLLRLGFGVGEAPADALELFAHLLEDLDAIRQTITQALYIKHPMHDLLQRKTVPSRTYMQTALH